MSNDVIHSALGLVNEEIVRAQDYERQVSAQDRQAFDDLVARLNQAATSLREGQVTQQVVDLFAERTRTYSRLGGGGAGQGNPFAAIREAMSYAERSERFEAMNVRLKKLLA